MKRLFLFLRRLYQPCLSAWGDNLQSNIEIGRSESLLQLFALGLTFFCQKRFSKMKYGLDGSIFKCQFWPVLAKQ